MAQAIIDPLSWDMGCLPTTGILLENIQIVRINLCNQNVLILTDNIKTISARANQVELKKNYLHLARSCAYWWGMPINSQEGFSQGNKRLHALPSAKVFGILENNYFISALGNEKEVKKATCPISHPTFVLNFGPKTFLQLDCKYVCPHLCIALIKIDLTFRVGCKWARLARHIYI